MSSQNGGEVFLDPNRDQPGGPTDVVLMLGLAYFAKMYPGFGKFLSDYQQKKLAEQEDQEQN